VSTTGVRGGFKFFRRHGGDTPDPRDPFAALGDLREQLALGLIKLSNVTQFTGRTLAALPAVFMHKPRRRELVTQLDALCVGALPITHVTGFIAGLILGVQTRVSLQEFGITSVFPELLTLSLVRELGPTFVSLVAGARAASGVASELATMTVTQQVAAMRALRSDPIQTLAAPRTLACILGFPMLSVVGVLAGLFGGMLIAQSLEQTAAFFFHQAFLDLSLNEIIPNLIVKPALFGLLIGVAASYLGLSAEGGTRAVGGATVRSVVVVTVGVLILDYIVGEFFRRVWPPPPF
jgi:phospholipid/cholesterol/gamma-HCH transport system permease protein